MVPGGYAGRYRTVVRCGEAGGGYLPRLTTGVAKSADTFAQRMPES